MLRKGCASLRPNFEIFLLFQDTVPAQKKYQLTFVSNFIIEMSLIFFHVDVRKVFLFFQILEFSALCIKAEGTMHITPIHSSTEYGLWTPRESFFRKPQTFELRQTNWAENNWGSWGIFGQTISTHFGTVGHLSMFSIISTKN